MTKTLRKALSIALMTNTSLMELLLNKNAIGEVGSEAWGFLPLISWSRGEDVPLMWFFQITFKVQSYCVFTFSPLLVNVYVCFFVLLLPFLIILGIKLCLSEAHVSRCLLQSIHLPPAISFDIFCSLFWVVRGRPRLSPVVFEVNDPDVWVENKVIMLM